MREFCENELCEDPGFKEVPVSVDGPGDQVRTLCAACEESYTWGVQHGQMTAGPDRLDGFLREGGFVVLAMNREDPSCGGPCEAWAYKGPLDFGKAAPIVFGVGQTIAEALEALDARVGNTHGAGRPAGTEAGIDSKLPGKDDCIRIVVLEVACMAADAEDVKRSLFDPDSAQPSWYYDHEAPLGPVQVSIRRPTTSEGAHARRALDVEE